MHREIDAENIFGLRIKRAAELIGEQGREAFWRTGIHLDAKLTSIVVALYRQKNQSSSDVAAATGLSRQLVEHRLRQLEEDGYVSSKIAISDARKRTYSLSPRRRREVARVVDTMADFEKVYEELWREIDIDLGSAILKLEKALRAKPLLARLCNEFPEYSELVKVQINEK